jgi:hypothetical protein
MTSTGRFPRSSPEDVVPSDAFTAGTWSTERATAVIAATVWC